MNFEDYQREARKTAIYPKPILPNTLSVYPVLGLAGEGGEVANKAKKVLRGDKKYSYEQFVKDLIDELGDVLWYISQTADDHHISLQAVAELNIEKLRDRQARGVIASSGDKR